jgi:hypothetical protein
MLLTRVTISSLMTKTPGSDFRQLGESSGGDLLHLLAGPPIEDTLPVQLREEGHAAEDGADGRTHPVQAAGVHDGFLSCQFHYLCTRGCPGLQRWSLVTRGSCWLGQTS